MGDPITVNFGGDGDAYMSDQKIQVKQLYQERTGPPYICILVEVAVDPVYFITLHYNKTSTLHYITLLAPQVL